MKKQKILFCNNYILDSQKKYTVNQLRLFYYVIYKFREINFLKNENNEIDFDLEIELDLEEIKKYLCDKHLTLNEIQNTIDNTPYSITYIDKDCIQIKKIFIFSYIETYINYGIIKYRFSENGIAYINDIYDNFSKMDLYELKNLKSKYSQRLYELSCKYVNQKYYTMKINFLIQYFNITKKYTIAEINRTILKKAIEEINNKTRINIKTTTVKKGRNITHIKFEFTGGYKKKR